MILIKHCYVIILVLQYIYNYEAFNFVSFYYTRHIKTTKLKLNIKYKVFIIYIYIYLRRKPHDNSTILVGFYAEALKSHKSIVALVTYYNFKY